RAEFREQVPGGAAYLDGDQRIERSVAEEDAKPLAVSLASRWDGGEREDRVHEARLRQRRRERHASALAEPAEERVGALARDLLDRLGRDEACLEHVLR